MKEQIVDELVLKAREAAITDTSDGGKCFDLDLFHRKFAKLIVQECVGCCEQVISDPVPESVDTWLNGGSQCIQEIKQHFGVKE